AVVVDVAVAVAVAGVCVVAVVVVAVAVVVVDHSDVAATVAAAFAAAQGLAGQASDNLEQAISQIIATEPAARILICGSLYLAGAVLREHH
ncbi:MAG: hypothetical protein ACPG4F_09385, partial [Paracoccaceae bacterium]